MTFNNTNMQPVILSPIYAFSLKWTHSESVLIWKHVKVPAYWKHLCNTHNILYCSRSATSRHTELFRTKKFCLTIVFLEYTRNYLDLQCRAAILAWTGWATAMDALLEDEPLWKQGVGRGEALFSVGRRGNRIKTQKELHSVKKQCFKTLHSKRVEIIIFPPANLHLQCDVHKKLLKHFF